jgi:choline kinase
VICAAGLGSRLGVDRPKALVRIGGRPLVHWQLDVLEDFPEVHVVVGFRHAEVIETVLARRRDAVFHFNHDFRSTNTLHSLCLGSRYTDRPILALDGDLLATRASLEAVRDAGPDAVGVTPTYSDEPVCVTLGRNGGDRAVVTGFSRQRLEWEWSGIALLSPATVRGGGDGYVYQLLARSALPLAAVPVECAEIDTEDDLRRAEGWIRRNAAA